MRFADRTVPFTNHVGEIMWTDYATSRGVQGFMHFQELQRMVELATDKDYMECGAYKGLSAWCVAHTARSVLSIDTFAAADNGQTQQDNYTTLAEYDRVTAEFFDVVTRIPYSSERAYELLPETATWDVVFIDGDHTYEGCLADLKRWWPRVRPGGVLCAHDYGHDHWPGATQACDEFFGVPSEPWIVTLRVVRKALEPEFYLHSWEDGAWSTLEQNTEWKFGGLSFALPGDSPCDSYPEGYKMWRKRSFAEAPDWVKQEFHRRAILQ